MGKRGLEPGAPDFDPKSLEGAESDVGFLGTPRVVDPENLPGIVFTVLAIVGVIVMIIT